jgi:hypothetical protein
MQESKSGHWVARKLLGPLNSIFEAAWRQPHEPQKPGTGSHPRNFTSEQASEAELERLQKLIEDRKRLARNTDISYHLWNLYQSHFRHPVPPSPNPRPQHGKWYDVKILQASAQNGLNTFEFELRGSRYTFIDDEEKQGWRENMKVFSLFLYDDSDRCLIEIPMKMRVDSSGRSYSISSDGPDAFLRGDWISDFINVRLKHLSIRNQDIRAQKHQQRLQEIEDLKGRFGIPD